MSTLNNPSDHKIKWSLDKFNVLFSAKADKKYLYIVKYFLQSFGFQNNHFSNGPWLAGGTLRRLREGQIYNELRNALAKGYTPVFYILGEAH